MNTHIYIDIDIDIYIYIYIFFFKEFSGYYFNEAMKFFIYNLKKSECK